MKRYFTRYVVAGRRHPFLFTTARELAARAKIIFARRDEFAVRAFGAVERAAKPEPVFPTGEVGDTAALATLNAAYLAALHHAGGDDKQSAKFAARARKSLLLYAEQKAPGYHHGYGWLVQLYLVTLALAYDLVWDICKWSAEEREALRRMFHSHIPDIIDSMHSKHMSNHGAWPMCRAAMTAFLYGEEKLAKEVMDGPDSYCQRLAHMFFDDGMSYEQSATVYQQFSVLPMLLTALAAKGGGTQGDPLRVKVSNDFSLSFRGGTTGDYDMPFYPVDEKEFPRPRWKDLRTALTGQFGLLRPDTTCPALGDYGSAEAAMSTHWIPEAAWSLYGDRQAARVLAMGGRGETGSQIFGAHFMTLAKGRSLPGKARFAAKSNIYPQAGYAVLRSVEGDAYWGSEATQAVMKFGPFGNGHGHADKLHLDISGAGHRCCSEDLDRKSTVWRYWNSTVSHNSVVVGGKSQPGDEEMFALNDSCGRLLGRDFSGEMKWAAAAADDVYEVTKAYRRFAGVTGEYVADVFYVEAGERQRFDWFLHGMGEAVIEGVDLEEKRLGARFHGYQYLADCMGGKTRDAFSVKFGAGHCVHFARQGEMEVFIARGPWRGETTRPALIVRKRAEKAFFAAVHDPSGRGGIAAAFAEFDGDGIILEVEGRGYRDRVTIAGLSGERPKGTNGAGVDLRVSYYRRHAGRAGKT